MWVFYEWYIHNRRFMTLEQTFFFNHNFLYLFYNNKIECKPNPMGHINNTINTNECLKGERKNLVKKHYITSQFVIN